MVEYLLINPLIAGISGGIIGAIIIIILLLAGGWYFIGNRVEKIQNQKEQAEEAIAISTGTSTEVADIQADLDGLDIDNILQD